jgi:NAD(P)-dependent dehydrogenase (short-subunit alcohol dehydrogenase family)
VPDARQLFSLAGRTALVTGASAGIGERLARVLAEAGARTAVVARRADALEALARSLPDAVALPADLADPGQVRDLADRALAELGRVDVLVNNAAYLAKGVAALDESYEQIQQTLAVNLVAPILLAQAFVPGMLERGEGSIVNVSSIVATVGIGRFPQAAYAASKGGLDSITREWAAQWSRFGVRVNNLTPGFIETEMTSSVIDHPKIHDWILRNTMIQRHGVPEDFDGALLFLASDASRYVTGQTVRVDGGWTAR